MDIKVIKAKASQYEKINAKIKALEEELDSVKKELIDEIGECEDVIVVGQYKVSYKSAVRESIDSKKLKEEFPEFAKKYMKSVGYRSLRVN